MNRNTKEIEKNLIESADKKSDGAKNKKESDDGISDAVRAYMNEIAKYPLLTQEEEVELAERMKNGDREARNKFIVSNLRLAVSIAQKRYYQDKFYKLQDLIQEANIGLMKAVEKFDPDKGKFSTYGTHWIKQNISRAIADCGKSIRLPVHRYDQIRKYNKAEEKLRFTLNREPTVEDIAQELGWDIEKATFVFQNRQEIRSLDDFIGDSEDMTLAETLKDVSSPDPSDIAEHKALIKDVHAVLSCLTPREEVVIRRRFGFDDGMSHTLEEVGQNFHVTRERIRQIEAKALRKLRHPSRIKKLKPYFPFYN